MNAAAVIEYMRQQQLANGSFAGQASASLTPFKPTRPQPTIFPTILILDCLRTIPDAEDICRRAADYVRSQTGLDGAYNYWDQASATRHTEPYPDDLDDTACAMAALAHCDDRAVAWGQFARLLVLAEQATGGPYNTWLVDTQLAPQWRQVDVAVNANIGYALSRQSVCPAGLRAFIETAIAKDDYRSAYYVGELPVVYFICRWYRGDCLALLQAKVRQLLAAPMPVTALGQALLLSAACYVGIESDQLQTLVTSLQTSSRHNHWPAVALYIDPVYDGRQHYGGSAVLTTAYVLEALQLYADLAATAKTLTPTSMLSLAALRRDLGTVSPNLCRQYMATARRVGSDLAGQQIYAAASSLTKATGWQTSAARLRQLNRANWQGWIAYTLYDDLLDGTGHISSLSAANVAMRRSYQNFLQCASQPELIDFVQQTFDTIDCANDWELQHARVSVRRDSLSVRRLPNYGNYSQLAHKSLGHSLAACLLAAGHYGNLQHPAVRALQVFYKHFLIARQLNDDAHDWEDDLQAGQLSAVVCLLLSGYQTGPYSLHFAQDIQQLRQHFWQCSLDQVAAIIGEHIRAAKRALQRLEPDTDVSLFISWLDDLEASVIAAEQGRDQARQFIAAFEVGHV